MFFHPSAKLIIYARVWNGMAIKISPPPDFYVPPPSFRSPLLHGEAGFGGNKSGKRYEWRWGGIGIKYDGMFRIKPYGRLALLS